MSGCSYWHFKGLRVSPEFSNQVTSNRYLTDSSNYAILDFYYNCRYITIEDCNVFTVGDSSSWTPNDWHDYAYDALISGPRDLIVHGCTFKNFRNGLQITRQDTLIENNILQNFCKDAIDIGGTSSANIIIQDNQILDVYDDNDTYSHSDCIQGEPGLTDAQATNWIIRRNYINVRTDSSRDFKSTEAAVCQGIYIDKMIDGSIENNVVMPDFAWAITLNSHGENVKIINNTVLMTYGATYSTKALIHLFNWAYVAGVIDGYGFSNVIVRNNIAHDFTTANGNVPTRTQLPLSATPPPILLCAHWDNVVVDNNYDIDSYTIGNEFVDYTNGNVHLVANSNFIDAGSSLDAPAEDLERNSRPQGLGYDIGAYEYISSTPPPPPPSILYGDISGDNTVNLSDASMAAQSSVGLITLNSDQTKKGDVSGDGKVSAYDAALILQKAAGIISRFPVEP